MTATMRTFALHGLNGRGCGALGPGDLTPPDLLSFVSDERCELTFETAEARRTLSMWRGHVVALWSSMPTENLATTAVERGLITPGAAARTDISSEAEVARLIASMGTLGRDALTSTALDLCATALRAAKDESAHGGRWRYHRRPDPGVPIGTFLVPTSAVLSEVARRASPHRRAARCEHGPGDARPERTGSSSTDVRDAQTSSAAASPATPNASPRLTDDPIVRNVAALRLLVRVLRRSGRCAAVERACAIQEDEGRRAPRAALALFALARTEAVEIGALREEDFVVVLSLLSRRLAALVLVADRVLGSDRSALLASHVRALVTGEPAPTGAESTISAT